MNQYKKLISWVFILVLWQCIALMIHNDILVPTIQETVLACFNLLKTSSFYSGICITAYRILKGFFISFSLALFLTSIVILKRSFLDWLEPIRILTKSIPNITYIIIAILWCGAEGAVSVILSMILFPIILNALLDEVEKNKALLDIQKMYKDTPMFTLKLYYESVLLLPMIQITKTSLAMGFKVGVMAEILSSVRNGMGRGMQYAKLNLDTATIFAYTICIFILIKFIDICLDTLQKHFESM